MIAETLLEKASECVKDFNDFLVSDMSLKIRDGHENSVSALQKSSKKDVLCVFNKMDGVADLIASYILWKVKYAGFVDQILLVCGSRSDAISLLDKIRLLVLSKPVLSDLISENVYDKGCDISKVTLGNGSVIQARGLFDHIRGRHKQLVILYDIVRCDNLYTVESSEKVSDFVETVVYPFLDKGTPFVKESRFYSQVVTVACARHESYKNDFYNNLMRRHKMMVCV